MLLALKILFYGISILQHKDLFDTLLQDIVENAINFIFEISKNFPDIIIKKYYRIDTGWMNRIIIVNDDTVFRFPRTGAGIKMLASELKLLSLLKGAPVKLPEYKFIHMEEPYFAGYKIIRGDTLDNAKSLGRSVLDDFMSLLNYMGTFRSDLLNGTLIPVYNSNTWIEYEKSLINSFRSTLELYTGIEYFQEILDLFDISMLELNDKDISLIHGDLSRGNVILNRKHSRVNGVIDWSDASYGDRALDIAAILEGFSLKYLPNMLSNFSKDFSSRAFKRILFYRLVSPLYRAYFLEKTGKKDEAKELCMEIINNKNSKTLGNQITNISGNF